MNREETLKLWREGKDAWNTWAEEMLAERKQLEESGKWNILRYLGTLKPHNDATTAWFEEAKAVFSSEEEPLTFDDEVNFADWVFPGDTSFHSATFSKSAIFNRATFSQDTTFNDATFSGNATFNDAAFLTRVSFREAKFSGYARFDNATFSGDAPFRNVTFSEYARFDNATFLKDVQFSNATFSENVKFNKATFSRSPTFYRATFSQKANFENVTFMQTAFFNKATFSEEVWFNHATFSSYAAFNEAMFSKYATFENMTSSGYTGFNHATFLKTARFSNATFSKDAKFIGASFKGSASYHEAHFQGPALFTAIKAERDFSIAGAHFQRVPDFVQANFAEAPKLDSTHLRPGFIEQGRFWKSVVKRLSKGDADVPARWRALKRLAIQGYDHERERQFFAMEIRSARFVTDWPFHWKLWDANVWNGIFRFWLGLLYQVTSNFGRSVLRPTLLLFASILFFAAIYLGESHKASGLTAPGFTQRFVAVTTVATPFVSDEVSRTANPCADVSGKQIQPLEPDLARRTDAIAEALQLSVLNGSVLGGIGGRNTVRRIYGCLYGLVRDTGSKTTPIIPLSVTSWSLLQKAISIVLIFLLGLAIRNILKVR